MNNPNEPRPKRLEETEPEVERLALSRRDIYARFLIIGGPNTGDTIEMDRPQFTFGRKPSPEIDCALPEASYVSAKHCTVFFREGLFSLVDHQSSNGTYIDDYVVKADIPSPLADGAIIQLGRTKQNSVLLQFERVKKGKEFKSEVQPTIQVPLPEETLRPGSPPAQALGKPPYYKNDYDKTAAHQGSPPTRSLGKTPYHSPRHSDDGSAEIGSESATFVPPRGKSITPPPATVDEPTYVPASAQMKGYTATTTLPENPLIALRDGGTEVPAVLSPFALIHSDLFRYVMGGSLAILAVLMLIGFFFFSWMDFDHNQVNEAITARLEGANQANFPNFPPRDRTGSLTAIQIWLGGNQAVLSTDKTQSGLGSVRWVDRLLILIPLLVIGFLGSAWVYLGGGLPAKRAFLLMSGLTLAIILIVPIWQTFSSSAWHAEAETTAQTLGLPEDQIQLYADASTEGFDTAYSYTEHLILAGIAFGLSFMGFMVVTAKPPSQ